MSCQGLKRPRGSRYTVNDADPANYEINNGAINISTTDLTNLANPPLIKPKLNESGQGLYFIVEEGRRQLLITFEDFVDELSEHLNKNADVRHIVAVGKFDNTASAMTVDWMTVSLK